MSPISSLDSQVKVLVIVIVSSSDIFVAVFIVSCVELVLHIGYSLIPCFYAFLPTFRLYSAFALFALYFKFQED